MFKSLFLETPVFIFYLCFKCTRKKLNGTKQQFQNSCDNDGSVTVFPNCKFIRYWQTSIFLGFEHNYELRTKRRCTIHSFIQHEKNDENHYLNEVFIVNRADE